MKPVSSDIAKLHYNRLFPHSLAFQANVLRPPNANGSKNVTKK